MKHSKRIAPPRRNIVITLLLVLFITISLASSSVLAVLFVKHATPQRLLSKLGIATVEDTNYALMSWQLSLEQLDYDSDIVFIGDSLTIGENFQSGITNKKVLNLGLSGDSLHGIYDRSKIISHFTPEFIFVEGGINSMSDNNVDELSSIYDSMINDISNSNPNAHIFIQSILPISNSRESGKMTNKNIVLFNDALKNISEKYHADYVDIYSNYVLDGQMNPEYTKDGIHLKDEYKHIWIDVVSTYVA